MWIVSFFYYCYLCIFFVCGFYGNGFYKFFGLLFFKFVYILMLVKLRIGCIGNILVGDFDLFSDFIMFFWEKCRF